MSDAPTPDGSAFPAGNADAPVMDSADSTTPVAQPLSAEEEQALRMDLTSPYGNAPFVVARLLATLDAERQAGRIIAESLNSAVADLDAARGSSPLTTQGPRSVPDPEAYVRGHWDGLHCEAGSPFGILDECEHVGRIHDPKARSVPSDRPNDATTPAGPDGFANVDSFDYRAGYERGYVVGAALASPEEPR